MAKFFHRKLIPIFFIGILLSSCNSKKENFDIDISNFKVTTKTAVKNPPLDNSKSLTTKKEIIKNELKNYPNKSDVLSATKFGKKDPFSEVNIEPNKLDSNFQLKGFLNTNLNNYALINYLGNEGTVTEESIGGLNTDLLPNGAKVLDIDPINMKLIIEYEDDNFTFEL